MLILLVLGRLHKYATSISSLLAIQLRQEKTDQSQPRVYWAHF